MEFFKTLQLCCQLLFGKIMLRKCLFNPKCEVVGTKHQVSLKDECNSKLPKIRQTN